MFNIDLVDNYMMRHHLTWADFCKLANIRMVDLKKFMSSDQSLKMTPFCRIVETVGATANSLLGLD